jgi:hypothetical protein
VHLVAVHTDDVWHNSADSEEVAADPATQIQQGGDVAGRGKPLRSMTSDFLGRGLLESLAREEHRGCASELVDRACAQRRLFGRRRNKIGGPLPAQSFGNGEVVTRIGEQLRGGEQLAQLCGVQRRMPASG